MFIKKISVDHIIKEVAYGSDQYYDIVDLRYEILRKPLRLNFTPEQLAAENTYHHLGYYHGEKLIACLMLVPEENGKMRMKQVAVETLSQGKGFGKDLVNAAEEFSKRAGFTKMYCHARDTAVPFYLKLEYIAIGEMFEEVSIQHLELEKML